MAVSEKVSIKEIPETAEIVITESEKERILRNLNMTDEEKFLSFSKMLRRQIMLKQAKITHK